MRGAPPNAKLLCFSQCLCVSVVKNSLANAGWEYMVKASSNLARSFCVTKLSPHLVAISLFFGRMRG